MTDGCVRSTVQDSPDSCPVSINFRPTDGGDAKLEVQIEKVYILTVALRWVFDCPSTGTLGSSRDLPQPQKKNFDAAEPMDGGGKNIITCNFLITFRAWTMSGEDGREFSLDERTWKFEPFDGANGSSGWENVEVVEIILQISQN